MPKTQIAKLFKNGASQVVRLPAEFRFSGDHVYLTRDEATNNVVLSERSAAGVWQDSSSSCEPSTCRKTGSRRDA